MSPGSDSSDRIASRPARVRLAAIGEALQLMKPHLLAWMGAALIAIVGAGVVAGVYFVFESTSAIRSAALHQSGTPSIAANLALAVVASALAAVFGGGMTRMAVRQARGEPLEIGDVFSALDVFGRLFGLTAAFSVIGVLLRSLPLGGLLSIAFWLLLGGLLLFAVPLIVDERLGVIEAVRLSAQAVGGQLPMAVLFTLVLGLMAGVGLALCLAPALFTIPLAVSAVGVLYRDFFGQPAGGSIPSGPPS